MARKPKNQGQNWTAKDLAEVKRAVKAGKTGNEIAAMVGRSLRALYQKASVEGISLSHPVARRAPPK